MRPIFMQGAMPRPTRIDLVGIKAAIALSALLALLLLVSLRRPFSMLVSIARVGSTSLSSHGTLDHTTAISRMLGSGP